MLANLLIFASVVVTAITVWVFWVRPILAKTPALAMLRAEGDSLFQAIKAKFAGSKGSLFHATVVMAGAVVSVYDAVATQLMPIVSQVDMTPLTSKVPGWAWPLITIFCTWAMLKFRELAEKRDA